MNIRRQRELGRIAAERVAPPAIEHGALAAMRNMAAVAASRLRSGRTVSAVGLRIVLELLKGIEILGFVGFLRRYGSEEDWRSTGANIALRYTSLTMTGQ